MNFRSDNSGVLVVPAHPNFCFVLFAVVLQVQHTSHLTSQARKERRTNKIASQITFKTKEHNTMTLDIAKTRTACSAFQSNNTEGAFFQLH